MGGGLMRLVAVWFSEIYLTGNPQITFFKLSIAGIQIFNGNYRTNSKWNCGIWKSG